MKSKTLIIVCALLCCISANAKVTDEPVKLTKNNTHSNGGPHRSPEPSVIVIINDTYIEFDTLYSGCSVTIIDSDGLTVYSLIIDENGDFYIGEWKKGLKHGKGIDYYKNGNIKYEGDFMKGKYDGIGKYIEENGDYYIGEWKNGLRNGKGILYDKNGNIKYKGPFF